MKNKLLMLSCLIVSLGSFLSAETYYLGVNDDPDDDLADLRGLLMPGDELIIKDGTYTDMSFKFYGMGTEENPITLRAETPGGVVLNGKSYVQIDGIYLIVRDLVWYNGDDYLRKVNSRIVEFRGSYYGHARHCRLTNCAIIDQNYYVVDENDDDGDGDTTDYLWEDGKKWIQIYGTHNRIDHCYFSNKKTQDVLMVVELGADYYWRREDPTRGDETPQYETYQHQIDHNYFGHISSEGWYDDGSPNGYEALRVGTSTYSNFNAEVTVEYNFFEACNGEAEVISNKSCNNIYRYNTLYECQGGIVMRHGDGCLVANNVILGNGLSDTGGIRINGQNHVIVGNYISGVRGTGMRAALTMRDAGCVTGDDTSGGYEQSRFNVFAYNTLIDCTEPLNTDSSGSSDNSYKPVSNTIVNNVIYSPAATQVITSDLTDSQFTSAVTTWGGNYVYAQSLGKADISGVFFEDPVMVLREDGLYTISREGTLSPAYMVAEDGFHTLSTDMDGDDIPAANADAGSDQSGADEIRAPMSADDVGPSFSLDKWIGN